MRDFKKCDYITSVLTVFKPEEPLDEDFELQLGYLEPFVEGKPEAQ